MKKTLALISIAGIMVLTFVGCATTSDSYTSEEATGLELAAVLKFSDIPIPQGFQLATKESFAFQNNDLRIALLKYTGRVPAAKTLSFFKDQMPFYNWQLINIVEYGSNVINFQRQDEVCTITIVPQGSKSQLVISVSPRSNVASLDTTETFIK